MIIRPVVVSPVNAIFAMRGLAASALPISEPPPVLRAMAFRSGV
jgi:hypothetical protein